MRVVGRRFELCGGINLDVCYVLLVWLTQKLELEKQASEQEATHLKHLLSLSEEDPEVAQALQQLQREDYPSKLARMESELAHQQQMTVLAEKDHEDLKRRYEEFGEQVEQYMNEQTQEKAGLISKGEEQVKQLQAQLETVNRQAQDALKAKQSELTRAMDQLKFRHDALSKAEKKIASLEERAAALEAQQLDTKLRHEKQVGALERRLSSGGMQWKESRRRLIISSTRWLKRRRSTSARLLHFRKPWIGRVDKAPKRRNLRLVRAGKTSS